MKQRKSIKVSKEKAIIIASNHNLTPFDGSSTAGERHERRINVLKANPELMSEYKNAVKNHTQKQTELKPKTKHKR